MAELVAAFEAFRCGTDVVVLIANATSPSRWFWACGCILESWLSKHCAVMDVLDKFGVHMLYSACFPVLLRGKQRIYVSWYELFASNIESSSIEMSRFDW